MNVIVIAPHPDDELIGVGGTIIKRIAQGNNVSVCFMTRGYPPDFSDEEEKNNREETRKCFEYLGIHDKYYLDFPASNIESVKRTELTARLLNIIKSTCPEEVYIPHFGDMQKDHQITAELAMVACRPKYPFAPKRIYAYETLSETGWNIPNIQNEFIPNVFENITDYLEKKTVALSFYQSQLSEFPSTRSIDAIVALAKFRGAVMNVPAAEAFMLVREVK